MTEYMDQPHFTDSEKRIFLAAMGREKRICGKYNTKLQDNNLMDICQSIEHKVRLSNLWEEEK